MKHQIESQIDNFLEEVIAQARKAEIPVSNNIEKNVIINTRAKARLGACKMKKGKLRKHFTIEIGSALLICEERQIKEVLAHEIIHTCPGCMNHSSKWKKYADIMNKAYGYNIKISYQLKDDRLSEKLKERYNYRIYCKECGAEIFRQRKSKVVSHPERYRCRCGGKLEVEEIVK